MLVVWTRLLAGAVILVVLGNTAGQAVGGPLPSGQILRTTRAQPAPPPDPAASGPYSVGATRRTLTRTVESDGSSRVLDTVIWYPAAPASGAPRANRDLRAPLDVAPDRSGAPYPVVLFSHGSGGVPWQSTYLTTHLASHGFVVVAPPHPGNTLTDCVFPCLPIGAAATEAFIESARQRPADIVFASDRVRALGAGDDLLLAGLVDSRRVGVAGHSFGAYTALEVVAQDDRFAAAVAMATGVGPLTPGGARNVRVPSMLMAGQEDRLVPFGLMQTLFAALGAGGAERWLVSFPRGGHFSFADVCPSIMAGCRAGDLPQPQAHTLINRWATAFLLRNVARDDRYAPLLDPALAAGDPDIQLRRALP